MKKLIISLLVAALIGVGFQQYQARAQAAPALLVLFCAASAGAMIFWVYVKTGEIKKRCIVLEHYELYNGWRPVCTNIMVVPNNLSKAFPAFSDQMSGDLRLYRVCEIAMPSNFTPQYNLSGTAQPFIY